MVAQLNMLRMDTVAGFSLSKQGVNSTSFLISLLSHTARLSLIAELACIIDRLFYRIIVDRSCRFHMHEDSSIIVKSGA
jgi:hypothetical protein